MMNTAIATPPIQKEAKKRRPSARKVKNPHPMYLVKTVEMEHAEALKYKKMFFDLGLPLTVEMVDKFFSMDGEGLLSIYFERELKARQNMIGKLDTSEWNDDPTGCTPEQYGLKLAKAWRERFFETGAPCREDYIYRFFSYHKLRTEGSILLHDYLQKEVNGTQYQQIEADNAEFEYV